jgi:hypothetical protein
MVDIVGISACMSVRVADAESSLLACRQALPLARPGASSFAESMARPRMTGP